MDEPGGLDLEQGLNESPSEKEGKFLMRPDKKAIAPTLNESPSEKEGKSEPHPVFRLHADSPLNESPSEKEGKSL